MKKITLSMLAIAILASCSKSENGTDANGLVPIKLHSGIELATKAPITGSETVTLGCWESSTTATYSGAPEWTTTAVVSVSGSAAAITLAQIQYYNANNTIKSYIKGWFPAGTVSNGTATFANTDGSVDAILSNEVNGSKSTVIASALTFEHITAQLKFQVIKGTGLTAGTKIKSIKVKGASLPTAFDLTKASTDADAATWTAATNGLTVLNLTEAEIADTEGQVGDPMMIQPVGNNTTIKLDVVTSLDGPDITFTDVTFTTDGTKIEKGKAYTITLTFSQSGITPTANITEWTAAAGSGTVQ